MRSLKTLSAALALTLIGCDGPDPRSEPENLVSILGLEDGSYLGGEQTTLLAHEGNAKVIRTELFLDGLRVAVDELAPFELAWDTREFSEAEHFLTGRAHLDSGEIVDADLAITIDNTAPTLDPLPVAAAGGLAFPVSVHDNYLVDRVEFSRLDRDYAPEVVDSPPFALTWPFACGTVPLQVKVVDAAGNVAVVDGLVSSDNVADQDCDGYLPFDDCDDADASVHPGASEIPEGFDKTCDGMTASAPGFDLDGDGVPSIGDGGNDCDDTNPAIHGRHYSYAAMTVPFTWSPGDAQLGLWNSILVNRGDGQIIRHDVGTFAAELVADDANPHALGASYDRVVYARGSELVFLDYDLSPVETLSTPATVRWVTYEENGDQVFLAYQSGTKVYYAKRSAFGWAPELLADAGEVLAEAPRVMGYDNEARVTFRTASKATVATRYQGAAFELMTVGPENRKTTAMTGGWSSFIAVDTPTGSGIYQPWGDTPFLRFDQSIVSMQYDYDYLVVGFADHTEVFATGDWRRTQTIPGVGGWNLSQVGHQLWAPGKRFSADAGMRDDAEETEEDGVDSNCDHTDNW